MSSTQTQTISPTAILQLGSAFFGAKTLLSAVGMGLFTQLAQEPLDGETLRLRLGLHERGALDFFDALVALGMLTRSEGRYANTPATDFYLDRNKPSYIGAWLEMAERRLFRIWNSLTSALKTGQSQNEFGEFDPFGAMYSNAETLDSFSKEMTAVNLPLAHAIVDIFPWKEYNTFIDIGTVQGGLPVILANTYAHLTGGGYDLPEVRPVFEGHVSKHGLSDRLRFYSGDFRNQPLPSADVLIMGHILVDWNVQMKQQLVANAHAALPKGGALIIYDMMIDDERCKNAMGLLMSLNMLLETVGGGEYTQGDCIDWMRDASFSSTRVAPLPVAHSMVIGVK